MCYSHAKISWYWGTLKIWSYTFERESEDQETIWYDYCHIGQGACVFTLYTGEVEEYGAWAWEACPTFGDTLNFILQPADDIVITANSLESMLCIITVLFWSNTYLGKTKVLIFRYLGDSNLFCWRLLWSSQMWANKEICLFSICGNIMYS